MLGCWAERVGGKDEKETESEEDQQHWFRSEEEIKKGQTQVIWAMEWNVHFKWEKHRMIKWQKWSKRNRQRDKSYPCAWGGWRKIRKSEGFLLSVTLPPMGFIEGWGEKDGEGEHFPFKPENKSLTKHWSQLRPVTRRLQKQSPLTGSHWEPPDTVPRWSHRQAGGTGWRAQWMRFLTERA